MKEKIVSIISGGLDSCAFTSFFHYKDLHLISFNYGQKSKRELEVVKELSEFLKSKYTIIDISSIKEIFGDNNQLTGSIEIKNTYEVSVVVTLRNALFLQIAMIYGYNNSFSKIIMGCQAEDYIINNGEMYYPDCSPQFLKAFENAMNFGTFKNQKKIEILTPSLLGLGKKDLIEKSYPFLGSFLFKTWSCYKSEEKHCGLCESCINRKKAFAISSVNDLTEYLN